MKAIFLGKNVVLANYSPGATQNVRLSKNWFARRPSPIDYLNSATRIAGRRPVTALERAMVSVKLFEASGGKPGTFDEPILKSYLVGLNAINSSNGKISFSEAKKAVKKALENSGGSDVIVAICAGIYISRSMALVRSDNPKIPTDERFKLTAEGVENCLEAITFATKPKIREGDPSKLNEKIKTLCLFSKRFCLNTAFKDTPLVAQSFSKLIKNMGELERKVNEATSKLPPEMAKEVRALEPTNIIFNAVL